MIRNFIADGFARCSSRNKGGRPPRVVLPQRREIKKVASSKPAEHGPAIFPHSLSLLAEFWSLRGVPGDIKGYAVRKADVGVPVRHRR